MLSGALFSFACNLHIKIAMSASGSFINQTYDDRDTTDLHYAGEWPSPQDGSWNASNVGESGTLSSTEDIRANVTFIFPIPANAVYYYGIPRCCGGLYAICVDCDPNNPIFEMIDAVNVTDDGKNPPVVLWSKIFDKPGIHQILLTNQNDSRFGHSQITIDRFDLQVPNTAQVVTSLISETPSATSTSSTSLPSATASPVAQSKHPTSVGAIIGAVAGIIVFISLIIIIWVLRRRRPRNRAADELRPQEPQMAPMPFYTSNPESKTISSTPSIPLSTGKRHRHNHYLSSDVVSSVTSTSSPVVDDPPSRPLPPPRREVDAGQIMDEFSDGETLPPEYDQVFRSAPSAAGLNSEPPPIPTEQLGSSSVLNPEASSSSRGVILGKSTTTSF